MKYGQSFEAQSVPQWRAYNVDYNALKHLVKVNTTRDQAQAVAIPGQVDTALQNFEAQFFSELSNQHDRAELFVTSKADEICRRLQHLEKQITGLLQRCTDSSMRGKTVSQKRREKFVKYDDQIIKCGHDIRNLQRFVDAQRIAFHKILKKYKKWTGSKSLSERFRQQVLSDPKSFTRTDLESLNTQYKNVLALLRASTPDTSGPVTPRTPSRRLSEQIAAQQAPQTYWNEYDDGSEAEEMEPYEIYVTADSSYPGSNLVQFVVSQVRQPVEMVKEWWGPSKSPQERRPLIRNGSYYAEQRGVLDTSADEDAYASSSDFPSGYVAHYATFPSVNDQKSIRYREKMLFRTCIANYSAAFILLLISGVLVTTGRHRLRVEVDAGAITGVVASLFFGVMGFACMLGRSDTIGWLHWTCVVATLITICILNGMLLVLIAGNNGL